MHLDRVERRRQQPRVGARRAHDTLLCDRVDGGHRPSLRVLVGCGADDARARRGRALRQRRRAGRAEQEEYAALGAHVAVGRLGEGVAAECGREHRGALEVFELLLAAGAGDEIDAAHDGEVDEARARVLERAVDRDERGGARLM
jgi:hypothetical protein